MQDRPIESSASAGDSRSECVLLYAKYPQRGRVKTRLSRAIGPEHAVALYRCFVRDLLAMLRAGPRRVCVCYAPRAAEADFREWLGAEYAYLPQRGSDLGARMKASFQQMFQSGCRAAVLVGSDLPDLPAAHIDTAFQQLEAHDAALGPTDDGGYYAIGFRADTFTPEAFDGIAWSTESVYAQTIRQLTTAGRTCASLPGWWDVDVAADLRQLASRAGASDRAPRTLRYLRQHPALL